MTSPGAGPYIVTTSPGCDCHIPELKGAGQHSPGCACFRESRLAVSDLEKANAVVAKATGVAGLCDVPEEGDAFTLQDGTAIEVRPTEWRLLVNLIEPGEGIPQRATAAARWPTFKQKTAILAAFNGRRP